MESRRQALRHATASKHAELDGLVGRPGDLRTYSRYLMTMTAFRASIEPAFDATASWPDASLVPLRIGGELLKDCADLHVSPLLAPHHFALGCGVSERLGALYVLEGAALGARILMRDAERIGLGTGYGARHLAKQVSVPERWTAYLNRLEQAADFELEAAISMANQVFDLAIHFAEDAPWLTTTST